MIITADEIRDLSLKLYNVDAVNFGEFYLRGGMYTPVYFDLRLTVSYPSLLESLSDKLFKVIENDKVQYDLICGVPYAALPLATCISVHNRIPMVMCRKEPKLYGKKKLIEGAFKPGQKCLIIEDVIVSGSSIIETAKMLREVGLTVTDVAFVLDREQGGRQLLAEAGIASHSILTMTQVVGSLQEAGKLDDTVMDKVRKFIADNNCYESAKKLK